jgi:hypothetical protein
LLHRAGHADLYSMAGFCGHEYARGLAGWAGDGSARRCGAAGRSRIRKNLGEKSVVHQWVERGGIATRSLRRFRTSARIKMSSPPLLWIARCTVAVRRCRTADSSS